MGGGGGVSGRERNGGGAGGDPFRDGRDQGPRGGREKEWPEKRREGAGRLSEFY